MGSIQPQGQAGFLKPSGIDDIQTFAQFKKILGDIHTDSEVGFDESMNKLQALKVEVIDGLQGQEREGLKRASLKAFTALELFRTKGIIEKYITLVSSQVPDYRASNNIDGIFKKSIAAQVIKDVNLNGLNAVHLLHSWFEALLSSLNSLEGLLLAPDMSGAFKNKIYDYSMKILLDQFRVLGQEGLRLVTDVSFKPHDLRSLLNNLDFLQKLLHEVSFAFQAMSGGFLNESPLVLVEALGISLDSPETLAKFEQFIAANQKDFSEDSFNQLNSEANAAVVQEAISILQDRNQEIQSRLMNIQGPSTVVRARVTRVDEDAFIPSVKSETYKVGYAQRAMAKMAKRAEIIVLLQDLKSAGAYQILPAYVSQIVATERLRQIATGAIDFKSVQEGKRLRSEAQKLRFFKREGVDSSQDSNKSIQPSPWSMRVPVEAYPGDKQATLDILALPVNGRKIFSISEGVLEVTNRGSNGYTLVLRKNNELKGSLTIDNEAELKNKLRPFLEGRLSLEEEFGF